MTTIPFPDHDIQRFWSRVDKSGDCWIWQGGYGGDRNKYGFFRPSGGRKMKMWYAHRFAYTAVHGPIPDGMLICHRCNNGHCVNPDHLYLGTVAQNTRDAVRDGLFFRGDRSSGAKLQAEQVIEIRRMAALGKADRSDLAEQYGVTASTIRHIINRHTWTCLDEA